MWISTTLLASRLADKVGEQDNKLENLACYFAKVGGCKLLWRKVQVLVTKPDWDLRGGIPEKVKKLKRRML